MEWVYLYKGKNSGQIKYVGRAKSAHNCALRIRDHRTRDAWHRTEPFTIFFEPCVNRADSEATEAQYINIYDPEFNLDKKGWGLNHYLEVPTLENILEVDEAHIDDDEMVALFLESYEKKLTDNNKRLLYLEDVYRLIKTQHGMEV